MRDPIFIKIAKTPFFAKVVAWFILLYGLAVFLMSIQVFLTGLADLSGGAMIYASINLIVGIGLVIVSFGFRHMQRWALDIYTVLTVMALIAIFVASEQYDSVRIVGVIVETILLVYFWFISHLFKPSPTFR